MLSPQGRNSPEKPLVAKATLRNALGDSTVGPLRLQESLSMFWVVDLRAVDRCGGTVRFTYNKHSNP
jgi:hypothetical protein